MVVGTVGRREGPFVLIDLNKATAVLPPEEQIEHERYNAGSKTKVYVTSVQMTTRGPEIRVSRTHPEMVKKIFEMEIPEIANGLVEIKEVAREAGYRSKVAVWTKADNVDPIGSCIGQRGSRIQTIIAELGGEKIDIIAYDEDAERFVINSLSPAKVLSVELNEESKSALVRVASDQYSLAIGRGGQNVRLASQLTGWQIIVEQEGGEKKEEEKIEEEKIEEPAVVEETAPTEEEPSTEEKPSAEEKGGDIKDINLWRSIISSWEIN